MAANSISSSGFAADPVTVLAFVGLLFAVYKLFFLVRYVAKLAWSFGLVRLITAWQLNLKTLGTWAVITGSTSGIGKEYAEQLAAKGMSIVLVSRNPEKLTNVASEIESKYGVATKTVVIDFTTGDMERYDNVSDALAGLDIGILVNNAGMNQFGKITDVDNPEKLFPDLIRCNVIAVTIMTTIVLPGMVERRRGAVINISSGSAFVPTPSFAVYGASKAYVDFFTRALQTEYQSSEIIFQSVLPYLVCTNMYKSKPSLFAPSASDCVRSCLATLGSEPRTAGYFTHELLRLFCTTIPEGLYKRIVFNMAEQWRSRLQKKKTK